MNVDRLRCRYHDCIEDHPVAWINPTDIPTDLCIRGEIAPGEYVIELFW